MHHLNKILVPITGLLDPHTVTHLQAFVWADEEHTIWDIELQNIIESLVY